MRDHKNSSIGNKLTVEKYYCRVNFAAAVFPFVGNSFYFVAEKNRMRKRKS